jgi:hypothetical protein
VVPPISIWENCDKALDAHGELLRLHDAYRAATAADPAPPPDSRPDTEGTTVIIPIPPPWTTKTPPC